MTSDDQERLRRFHAGDRSAVEEWVEAYRRPLFGFILKMTTGQDEAEDIFQETWARALKHLHRFHKGHLLSWLFNIAHHLIIDRARKRKPDTSLQAITGDHSELGDCIESPSRDPAQLTGDAEFRQRLQSAVARLPADQRAVFLMRAEADLPFRDIARIQGVSLNTALGRMHYAVVRLRKELAEDYAALHR